MCKAHNRTMRKLTLTRIPGTLGDPVDVLVITNARTLGEMKANEGEKTFEIAKGENAVQVQIEWKDGKLYRSNAMFMIGKKDLHFTLETSGTKLVLRMKK